MSLLLSTEKKLLHSVYLYMIALVTLMTSLCSAGVAFHLGSLHVNSMKAMCFDLSTGSINPPTLFGAFHFLNFNFASFSPCQLLRSRSTQSLTTSSSKSYPLPSFPRHLFQESSDQHVDYRYVDLYTACLSTMLSQSDWRSNSRVAYELPTYHGALESKDPEDAQETHEGKHPDALRRPWDRSLRLSNVSRSSSRSLCGLLHTEEQGTGFWRIGFSLFRPQKEVHPYYQFLVNVRGLLPYLRAASRVLTSPATRGLWYTICSAYLQRLPEESLFLNKTYFDCPSWTTKL